MELFKSIDWDLLRQQKMWLLQHDSEMAYGLLNLLDNLQDEAVVCGVDKDLVFDKVFD